MGALYEGTQPLIMDRLCKYGTLQAQDVYYGRGPTGAVYVKVGLVEDIPNPVRAGGGFLKSAEVMGRNEVGCYPQAVSFRMPVCPQTVRVLQVQTLVHVGGSCPQRTWWIVMERLKGVPAFLQSPHITVSRALK